MNYKEKYDQALERAKHSDGIYPSAKELKEYIFPELRESEDERIKEAIIATIHLYYGEPLEDEAKEMIAWLEKQGQSIVWSEEDENYVNDLIAYFTSVVSLKHTEENTINWLKSLKDRVQPQPKQEWSEEDEEILKELTKFIPYHLTAHSYNQYYNWAISHRPQPHWKPSESDILLLERIANNESNPQDFQASLGGLIGQLKKLMEE